MADPLTQFFSYVGAELFSGNVVGAFLIMNAEALAYTTLIAGSIATSKAMQRRAEAKARDARNAALQDRTEVIRSGTAPSPFVFGRARVGGVLALAEESGSLKQYLHLVIAHVRHECDAIETVLFGDEALPVENVTTGFIESGTFAKSELTGKHVTVTTNGSGVATLSENAQNVLGVTVVSTNTIVFTFTHTPGTATVSDLPPSTSVSIIYNVITVTPLVRIRKHLGAAGQVADSDLIAEIPGWSSSDVGVSVCYSYVRLQYDHDVFGSVGIPRISVILRGFKVYDPRTATTYWSTNAQLCASAHVLNQVFGMRGSASELVWSEQIPFANICDEEVPIYNSDTASVTNGSAVVNIANSTWYEKVRPGMLFVGPDSVRREIKSVSDIPSVGWRITLTANYSGSTNATAAYSIVQKRYEVNGALGSDDTVWANFESILGAMSGFGVYVQGRWIIQPGYHPSVAMTIGESFLAGSAIQVVPHRGRRDTFNAVRGKFFDRFELWQKKDYPAVTSSTYETQDGGERIFGDLDQTMVDNPAQSQRLAKIELLKSRQSLTVKLTTNMKGYDLRPGSVINLSLAIFGFVAKPFIVLHREYDFEMEVTYFLQETAAAIYDWAFNEALASDPAPDSNLPSAFVPPASMSNVTLESAGHLGIASDGTVFPRVLVSWDPITDVFVKFGGHIEIEWLEFPTQVWISAGPVSGDRTSHYIVGPTDYAPIIVRTLAVSVSGRSGNWAYSLPHYVQGKSALPGTVTNLNVQKIPGAVRITWDQDPEPDRDVTELRRASTNVWSSGVRVDNGGAGSQDVPSASYDWAWPANGSYYIMAKYRDTSGNQSATHASYAVTIANGELTVIDIGSIGGSNFVLNSSFEADSNADGLSDQWTAGVSGTTGSVTTSRPTGSSIHGVYAQQISLSGLAAGGSNLGYLYQIVDLPGGCIGLPCIFSAHVKTTAGQGSPKGRIEMEFRGVSGLISSASSSSYFLSTTTLERKSISAVVPAGTTSIYIYIIIEDRTAGTGATLMIVDGVQLELGTVMTQYSPRADEILVGQVGTIHMALASATKVLGGSASGPTAGGVAIPFDVTTDAITLSYTNDTGGTIDIQVEATIDHCYLYNSANMGTGQLLVKQTGAVGGDTTAVLSDLLNAPNLDTPIPLSNPVTGVYFHQLASGSTYVAKLQLRCASTLSSASQVNVSQCRMRLSVIKR